MERPVIKHVTGCAPLILTDRNGVGSFIAHLHDNHAIPLETAAEAEAERLIPLFETLDARLLRIAKTQEQAPPSRWSLTSFFRSTTDSALRKVTPYQPGSLKFIFEKVAPLSQSMMFSQVNLIPRSYMVTPEIKALEGSKRLEMGGEFFRNPLMPVSKDSGVGYFFGFASLRDTNGSTDQYGATAFTRATAFPVMALDDDMLDSVSRHNPRKMLGALQSLMTLINHDMLHHFTNTINPSDIRRTHNPPYESPLREVYKKWTVDGDSHPMGYEGSLVLSHAATWNDLRSGVMGTELLESIETYFDELGRIAEDLKNDPSLSAADRHAAVDYFATAAGFALARVFALDDPVLKHAIERMQSVDPDPSVTLAAAASRPDPARKSDFARAVKNYRDSGSPLDGADHRYLSARQMQLAEMMPNNALSLSPGKKGSDEYKARKRIDTMDLDIFRALSTN